MKKARVLIRDFKYGQLIKEDFEELAKEKGLEVEVKTVNFIDEAGITYPLATTNYDVYLLHYSEVALEELGKLRKQNPKALICGLFGGGYLDGIRIKEGEVFDQVYNANTMYPVLSKRNLEDIINTIKQSRG